MKIGIDISQIVHGTGVSNYTRELITSLAAIDKKNEYILFGSSLRQFNNLRRLKGEFSRFPNFQLRLIPVPPTILELLWNRLHLLPIEKLIGNVDIFHSSDWVQPPVRSASTKKVTTVHDLVALLFPSSVHPKILSVQKRRLAQVKKQVDQILADSQSTKDDLVKFLQIDPQKIKVVYLAPSSDFHPQDDQKIKEVLEKYKIKKPYILSVATLEPRKNIQKLIDAFAKVQSQKPEFSLVLTGKYGWGSGVHTGQSVIWTGFVPREDLVTLYAGCRVFVYPSLYEGFGLPVLEAMACGAPVITSNNSSLAEIARDTAILIDPRSERQLIRAINMVLDLDLETYQKMVRASLDRARLYSWVKTAKETLKIYEGVAKTSD